ncbi:hypothetical protein OSL50_26860, partial [Escherichia coli]|nr:hypothetical protein [Escherichia coli]
TRPGASPDTIETVPLEETMPLRGYKDAFAYQNVRSNKDPSGRGVSNSVTAAQATNAGGYAFFLRHLCERRAEQPRADDEIIILHIL